MHGISQWYFPAWINYNLNTIDLNIYVKTV
jgi:hypothetical protein